MTYFRGMEGARAWLSWAVVFSHIVHMTGADFLYPYLKAFLVLGDYAVNIFIMISGFVITSLILEKHESYKVYISRRFLRIYPVYLLCLIIGVFASEYYADVMMAHPWGAQSMPTERLAESMASLDGNGYLYHILAHLSLLHGAIPNNILYDSQYMFLAPAWSLSLEWQFYLIAPFLIVLIRKPHGAVIAALLTLFFLTLYQAGLFGFFRLHSILAGAGVFFAVGIGYRFLVDKLPRLQAYPLALILIAIGASAYGYKTFPFILFSILVIYTLVDSPLKKPDVYIEKIMHAALDSRIAKYLGKISYSTYLIHAPIIQFSIYLLCSYTELSLTETALVLCVIVPPLTLAASSLINKVVEQPFIDFGRRVFSKKQPQKQP